MNVKIAWSCSLSLDLFSSLFLGVLYRLLSVNGCREIKFWIFWVLARRPLLVVRDVFRLLKSNVRKLNVSQLLRNLSILVLLFDLLLIDHKTVSVEVPDYLVLRWLGLIWLVPREVKESHKTAEVESLAGLELTCGNMKGFLSFFNLFFAINFQFQDISALIWLI